ncbi:hypothetical protein POVWA1_022790 [Plasmodium ovale wallikeri]|uniref:Uncharacterized protein n=1 Tax=Plasmodium ovale wallikeri TaxID=864142 RepID=A0A1A8YSU6_PLAOA|nr:hypothetical protein POVWA1_022790 [Plasmodium ovale wallikeri]
MHKGLYAEGSTSSFCEDTEHRAEAGAAAVSDTQKHGIESTGSKNKLICKRITKKKKKKKKKLTNKGRKEEGKKEKKKIDKLMLFTIDLFSSLVELRKRKRKGKCKGDYRNQRLREANPKEAQTNELTKT